MPVSSSDIKLFKSSIGDSEGGTATATQIVAGVKNNLWPDVSDAERAANGTRYRKVFLGNDHSTDSMVKPQLWLAADVPGFAASALGLGFDDVDDDTAAQGTMTALGANALIEAVSTAADTRTAQLVGRNVAGDPISESLVLNGTTPVLSVATFSKLYAILMGAEHVSNTVTFKQGAAGTTRGTIGPNVSAAFLWVLASSEAAAIIAPDLIAGARLGIWMRQSWTGGVLAQRPATPILRVEES